MSKNHSKSLTIPAQVQKQSKMDVRCSDCLAFEKGPFIYGKPCKLNGILPERPAPQCFTPDFTKIISSHNPMMFHQLGFILSQMTIPQVRILSSMINRSVLIKKYTKFQFGQEVYLNLSGSRDYLSNYFKGYVVGYLKANGCVYIASRMDKSKAKTSSIAVFPESVMTKEEYKSHASKLIESGLIEDPKSISLMTSIHQSNLSKNDKSSYEPPSLESAPRDWFAPHHIRARLDEDPLEKKKKITDTVDQMEKFQINT